MINEPFIANQDFENIPPAEEEKLVIKKTRKAIFIFAGIFGSLLLILLGTAIFLNFRQDKIQSEIINSTTTPTPTPETKEEIISTSPYATDEAILKIEEDLKNLEQELQEADIKEVALNPPVLDW